MRPVVAVLTCLALWVAGALIGPTVWEFLTTPECPTEDSCTVDYRDGAWHVEPAAP